jgi:hypothetical protein
MLAEDNNVNWKTLQGSGPDGQIVDSDVLEFLARVMAGEEELNPTPEPLPDGVQSWDTVEGVRDTDSWFSGPAASGSTPEPGESAAESEFELSDDIFLFDGEDGAEEDGTDFASAAEPADAGDSTRFGLSLEEDDGFDLFGNASSAADSEDLDDDSFLSGITTGAQESSGLLDDDFYDDDFLTDLSLEDGELDTPEAADADLGEFGLSGSGFSAAADDRHDDLLVGGLSPLSRLSHSAGSDEQDTDAFGTADGSTEAVFRETGLRSLEDYLQEGRFVEADAEPEPAPQPGFEFESGSGFELEAGSGTDFEIEFEAEFEPESEPELESAAMLAPEPEHDRFEVDFSGVGSEAAGEPGQETASEADSDQPGSEMAADAADSTGDGSDFSADFGFAAETLLDESPETAADEAGAQLPPAANIPLVSHGTVLRRHADVTLLGQARQAAGIELGQREPVGVLPFLLRAAARAAHLLEAGTAVTGAAIIRQDGVFTEQFESAAHGSFGELARSLMDPEGSGLQGDASGLSVIVVDMSGLEIDEAVLHLGSPVLALGRILSDSEQGTNHSTLTLSGEFNVAAGAEFLQAVSELLASPIRLFI